MNAWIQKSDYSAEDFELSSLDEALKKWNSIDRNIEDLLMKELEEKGEDYCSWGFSVKNEEGLQIHIYRNSTEENLYSALISKNHVENHMEKINDDFIPGILTAFFNNWKTLLPEAK